MDDISKRRHSSDPPDSRAHANSGLTSDVGDVGDGGVGTDKGEIFVRLLLEHEPQVRVFLRRLLPTWNDVDEVLQEASLVAWRKFDEFQQGTAFGGWLLTIARFEALKYRRRIAKTPLVFADDVWEMLASDEADDTEATFQPYLQSCLEKLGTEQRALVLHVHTPGVVIREVALASGRSEEALYKAIQRLRTTLLDCVTRSIAREGA